MRVGEGVGVFLFRLLSLNETSLNDVCKQDDAVSACTVPPLLDPLLTMAILSLRAFFAAQMNKQIESMAHRGTAAICQSLNNAATDSIFFFCKTKNFSPLGKCLEYVCKNFERAKKYAGGSRCFSLILTSSIFSLSVKTQSRNHGINTTTRRRSRRRHF